MQLGLAQRAFDDVNQAILRREARRRPFDEHIEQAKAAARKASLVVKRAEQAFAQSIVSAAAGTIAAPSPSTCPHGCRIPATTTRCDVFFMGGVAFMASAPRVDFYLALATAVGVISFTLLTSGRPASWQADALSVEAACSHMDCTPYTGQTRAAPTLALVKALLMAHDEAPDPVF